MKKLILIALFIPVMASAQKFDLSEMAGYSIPQNPSQNTTFNSGFCNQLSLNYNFSRHFSLGLLYEFNEWNAISNALGLVGDWHIHHFYFGVSVTDAFISNARFNDITGWGSYPIKYSPSLTIGGHCGFKERLTKRVSLKEQLGSNFAALSGTTPGTTYFNPTQTTTITHSQSLTYFYFLVGIAWRL